MIIYPYSLIIMLSVLLSHCYFTFDRLALPAIYCCIRFLLKKTPVLFLERSIIYIALLCVLLCEYSGWQPLCGSSERHHTALVEIHGRRFLQYSVLRLEGHLAFLEIHLARCLRTLLVELLPLHDDLGVLLCCLSQRHPTFNHIFWLRH